MTCFECNMVQQGNLIVKERNVSAFLAVLPAAIGHVHIVPNQHFPILETIPDELLPDLASLTKKITQLVFDAGEATATNVIINNGTAAGQESAHMTIHVIPRMQRDGLQLGWQPIEIPDEQLDDIEKRLRHFLEQGDKQQQEQAIQELHEEAHPVKTHYAQDMRRIP